MFIFFAALTCLMVLVFYFDFTRYIIPNWLNLVLLALYPAMVWMAPVAIDWKMAMVGALILFVVGYIMFMLNWIGGGDVKLFAVLALWVGLQTLPEYVMVVALLGGGLSIGVIMLRKILEVYYKPKEGKDLPRVLRHGQPLPYGLAIASGFLGYLWTGNIPGIAGL